MSQNGLKLFAEIVTRLQTGRQELLRMGTGRALGTPAGNQDIRLGQLLEKAREATNDGFIEITMEDTKRATRRNHPKQSKAG